jgi:hypothetical protein
MIARLFSRSQSRVITQFRKGGERAGASGQSLIHASLLRVTRIGPLAGKTDIRLSGDAGQAVDVVLPPICVRRESRIGR